MLEGWKPPLGTLMAVIPGHRARLTNVGTPLARLAELLAGRNSILTAAVDALVRCHGVEKLAARGHRSAGTQTGSMRVESPLIRGAVIVVL